MFTLNYKNQEIIILIICKDQLIFNLLLSKSFNKIGLNLFFLTKDI